MQGPEGSKLGPLAFLTRVSRRRVPCFPGGFTPPPLIFTVSESEISLRIGQYFDEVKAYKISVPVFLGHAVRVLTGSGQKCAGGRDSALASEL